MVFVYLLVYVALAVLCLVGLVLIIRYGCAKMGFEPIVQTISIIIVAMLFLLFLIWAFQGGHLPGVNWGRGL